MAIFQRPERRKRDAPVEEIIALQSTLQNMCAQWNRGSGSRPPQLLNIPKQPLHKVGATAMHVCAIGVIHVLKQACHVMLAKPREHPLK